MPVQAICDRILTDAQSEAERLKGRAALTAVQIEADAKAGAERLINDALEAARRGAAQRKRQQLAAARLAARDRVLAAKRSVIDEAFVQAAGLIDGMAEDQYVELLVGLIVAHARGGEEVIFDPGDPEVAVTAVEQANAALKAGGRGPVTLAPDTRPIGKGFILTAGRVEESFSLNALLEAAREELEETVARLIFGVDT